MWDCLFFLASVSIALAIGMALGNLIAGIPLDKDHIYVGKAMMTFFRPYPALVGIMTLSLFMLHGSIYLVMKTEGPLQERLKGWVQPNLIIFLMTYAIVTMVTLIYQEHMVADIRQRPFLFLVVLANMLIIANIPREIHHKNYGRAFICSCLNIAFLLALFAIGTFPDVIRSNIDPQNNSITVVSAAASLKTLKVLAVIVAIGLPFVFGYGYYVYRLFSGKVKLDHMSY